MKVTININGTDVEIQLTPEQEALAVKQSKPEFKWDYEKNKTYFVRVDHIDSGYDGTDPNNIMHGRYRKTKQTAEQSLARNNRANRLEALAEQLDGLVEFVYDEKNYYICTSRTEWERGYSTNIICPEVVYMTRECAIEICRMLNEGEFSLDVEL